MSGHHHKIVRSPPKSNAVSVALGLAIFHAPYRIKSKVFHLSYEFSSLHMRHHHCLGGDGDAA